MRRIARWIFNGATTLSATLSIVTAVFWLRSYTGRDWVRWFHQSGDVQILCTRPGNLIFCGFSVWEIPEIMQAEKTLAYGAGGAGCFEEHDIIYTEPQSACYFTARGHYSGICQTTYEVKIWIV